jgi:hypothetical protein
MTKSQGEQRTIAVMQPYFFPYAGYFRLLDQADEFVIFDCVQFRRRGRIHRTEVPDANGNQQWLTLPIAYSARETAIRDIQFAEGARAGLDERLAEFPWIRASRGQAAEALRTYLFEPLPSFTDFLEEGLKLVASLLGITVKISRSSSLAIAPELHGQDRVLAIVKALHGTRYLNSPGGRALYEPAAFAAAGVELRFLPDYVGPYSSMLHALMTEDLLQISTDVRGIPIDSTGT